MTLTQIKYFLKTAEKCNFTQAAAELYITQQVLSKQIQALEKEIGFSLFERTNRRQVLLTPAGQLMLDTWKPLIEQTEEALIQAATMQQKKVLRFGMPNIVQILDTVIPVVQAYMEEQDEYEVEFVVESSNKIRWMFEKKELDVLLAFSINTSELQLKHQHAVLKKMEFGVICNKKHPIAKKTCVKAVDLHLQDVCMFNKTYAKDIEKNLLDIYKNAGIKPKSINRYDNWRNMALAMELGRGINLGFRDFVEEQRGLVYVPLDKKIWDDEIRLIVFAKDENATMLVEDIKKCFNT